MKKQIIFLLILTSFAVIAVGCGKQDVAGRKSGQVGETLTANEIVGKYNSRVQYGDQAVYINELILFPATDNPKSDDMAGIYYYSGSTEVDGIITGTYGEDGYFRGEWSEGYQSGPFAAKFSRDADGKNSFDGDWRYSGEAITYNWDGTETTGSKLLKSQIKKYIEQYEEFEDGDDNTGGGNEEDEDGDVIINEDDLGGIEVTLDEDGQPIKSESDAMELVFPDLGVDSLRINNSQELYAYIANDGNSSINEDPSKIQISFELIKDDSNVEEGYLYINIPQFISVAELANPAFMKTGQGAENLLGSFAESVEVGDTVKICIDTDDVVYETHEDNNCFSKTITSSDLGGVTITIE